MSSGSFSLSFRRLRLRVEIFSMISRVSSTPLVNRRLLVFSSWRSAWSTLPPRRSVRRFRRSSVRMRISSARFFSSLKTCVASMALWRSSFSPLAGEDLDVHDGAFDARRAVERSVANIAGLFAEDGAEQLFFWCERGLALGRNLANEDVAGLHNCADPDDAAFVEVAEERLADVGNIASDFLGAKLGVARLDFILLDVNRSVVVVLDQLFTDQDGVFEVVAAPREEGHENVAAKSEFAALRAGTIGKNLALLHAVAHANQRLLADASVLVRTLEFDQLINLRADFTAEHTSVN